MKTAMLHDSCPTPKASRRWFGVACVLTMIVSNARVSNAQGSFDDAATKLVEQLELRTKELATLRESIAPEKIRLGSELSALEEKVRLAREAFNEAARKNDTESQRIVNLTTELKRKEGDAAVLRGLFDEFRRDFAGRLHITEKQRFADVLNKAKVAAGNTTLSNDKIYEAELGVVSASIDRLDEGIGGTIFKGVAIDSSGALTEGAVALIGPIAVFRTASGNEVGIAEERLNATPEPTIAQFKDPVQVKVTNEFFANRGGIVPLDPTLGDASKIAATEETFLEHVQKGGAVMIPIFALAGIALLIAIWKWISLTLVPRPSRRQVRALLEAVANHDEPGAIDQVRGMKGPVGRMLAAGVDNLRQPRELIEEVMYEIVLKTRLKLQSMLPFIALSAASAPLLGLLGTVTGIINTFKLLQIFGGGKVQDLSSGISEALITTKFGLIVAIPSLLLHAYLSRKAKNISGEMETTAIEFINQVGKSPFEPDRKKRSSVDDELHVAAAPDPVLVREQVQEILGEMLGPLSGAKRDEVSRISRKSVGS
ncbi:MAG: MotA/TolQ/ExbB proton channel family protein [Planctomycetes bacterium]|nr:MotA/TolQ/ExbB proton channel family protein [Planctomycetota bacterium]